MKLVRESLSDHLSGPSDKELEENMLKKLDNSIDLIAYQEIDNMIELSFEIESYKALKKIIDKIKFPSSSIYDIFQNAMVDDHIEILEYITNHPKLKTIDLISFIDTSQMHRWVKLSNDKTLQWILNYLDSLKEEELRRKKKELERIINIHRK